MRTARRWLATATVAASALALAACDGGEDPTTDPPETTVTEATTEPTEPREPTEPTEDATTGGPTGEPPEVEEPTAPPEMAVDDPTGAAATTYYFLNLYDYMRATGDTAAWEALSSPECEWCTGTMEDVLSLHAAGGWIESPGLDFDITTARVELPDSDHPYYTVRLRVVEPAFQQVSGDGTVQEGAETTLDPFIVAVAYAGGSFEVTGVNYAAD